MLALFALFALGLVHGLNAQCTAGTAVQNPKIGRFQVDSRSRELILENVQRGARAAVNRPIGLSCVSRPQIRCWVLRALPTDTTINCSVELSVGIASGRSRNVSMRGIKGGAASLTDFLCACDFTSAGSCPTIAASFTPSFGGDNCMDVTAAHVDTMFSNKLSEHAQAGNATGAGCKEYYKNIWNGDIGCFEDPDRIKAAPGCDWACAWANMEVKQATDCTGNAGKFKCGEWWWPSCEDMSAMMTAVCTDSAETIKTEIDQIRNDERCKNTANGGVRFNPTIATATPPAPTTPAPTTTPTPVTTGSTGAAPRRASAVALVLAAAVGMAVISAA